ncbi:hypothetical protein YenMTG1_203 [Yersinia phage vB_YenM_TG1]|uniref:Uncharacterized protein n=1 Tax=Yersinia phage vB_YenM_TG1 TaxID=1589265 RepID=A0A0B4ZZN1_9CAUD|nr:hypothetical protein AVV33_gp192 [Yersinia phage vB_YenM_TG1]AJD82013.1 hypothetical protein YenMTG1_203 [Yersinia phage vB_YenM_TG1]
MIFNTDLIAEIPSHFHRRVDAKGNGGFVPCKDSEYFVMFTIIEKSPIMYGPYGKAKAEAKAFQLKSSAPAAIVTLLESKGEVKIEFSIH